VTQPSSLDDLQWQLTAGATQSLQPGQSRERLVSVETHSASSHNGSRSSHDEMNANSMPGSYGLPVALAAPIARQPSKYKTLPTQFKTRVVRSQGTAGIVPAKGARCQPGTGPYRSSGCLATTCDHSLSEDEKKFPSGIPEAETGRLHQTVT
jgi:hypothetical protein